MKELNLFEDQSIVSLTSQPTSTFDDLTDVTTSENGRLFVNSGYFGMECDESCAFEKIEIETEVDGEPISKVLADFRLEIKNIQEEMTKWILEYPCIFGHKQKNRRILGLPSTDEEIPSREYINKTIAEINETKLQDTRASLPTKEKIDRNIIKRLIEEPIKLGLTPMFSKTNGGK